MRNFVSNFGYVIRIFNVPMIKEYFWKFLGVFIIRFHVAMYIIKLPMSKGLLE